LARLRAIAAPIPRVPPVTKATRPANLGVKGALEGSGSAGLDLAAQIGQQRRHCVGDRLRTAGCHRPAVAMAGPIAEVIG